MECTGVFLRIPSKDFLSLPLLVSVSPSRLVERSTKPFDTPVKERGKEIFMGWNRARKRHLANVARLPQEWKKDTSCLFKSLNTLHWQLGSFRWEERVETKLVETACLALLGLHYFPNLGLAFSRLRFQSESSSVTAHCAVTPRGLSVQARMKLTGQACGTEEEETAISDVKTTETNPKQPRATTTSTFSRFPTKKKTK